MNTTYVGHKIYVVNQDGTIEYLPIFVNVPKDIDTKALLSLLEESKWGLEETQAKQSNSLLASLRK
jgi:hypothetical protein